MGNSTSNQNNVQKITKYVLTSTNSKKTYFETNTNICNVKYNLEKLISNQNGPTNVVLHFSDQFENIEFPQQGDSDIICLPLKYVGPFCAITTANTIPTIAIGIDWTNKVLSI
jgi:hypothetical protein